MRTVCSVSEKRKARASRRGAPQNGLVDDGLRLDVEQVVAQQRGEVRLGDRRQELLVQHCGLRDAESERAVRFRHELLIDISIT